jgi:NAD(P)H-quinone oxidoreductase subunit 4L
MLENFLGLAAALFFIGVYGLLTTRNLVRFLMSIELVLNAINLNFITFSNFVDSAEIKGQIFALFIITLAAAEAAIALSIILTIYRNQASLDLDDFKLLKW